MKAVQTLCDMKSKHTSRLLHEGCEPGRPTGLAAAAARDAPAAGRRSLVLILAAACFPAQAMRGSPGLAMPQKCLTLPHSALQLRPAAQATGGGSGGGGCRGVVRPLSTRPSCHKASNSPCCVRSNYPHGICSQLEPKKE